MRLDDDNSISNMREGEENEMLDLVFSLAVYFEIPINDTTIDLLFAGMFDGVSGLADEVISERTDEEFSDEDLPELSYTKMVIRQSYKKSVNWKIAMKHSRGINQLKDLLKNIFPRRWK